MPVETFVSNINDAIVNPLIQLLIGIAAIVFLWGVFQYIMNSDSPEERRQGTRHILWGLIGIVIMFSVKGIIALIENTLIG